MSDPIVWRIHLASPPEQVIPLLTTADGLARWLAPVCRQEGDAFVLEHPTGQRLSARLRAVSEPGTVAMDYLDGTATFALAATPEGGTDLTLTHEGFPEEDRGHNHAGWVTALLTLKAALDHAIDLRNRDAERGWSAGYCDV